jgi:predicted flap endonuclease-1-like 5' DNA nuclease
MIWHFLEVWLLLGIAFVVGCVLGAYLYGVMADSRLALAQGAVADQLGDVLDRVKAGLGVGPAWRPQHLRAVDRPLPPEGEPDDIDYAHTLAIEEPVEAFDDEPEELETGDPERLASAEAVGPDGIVPMRPAGLAGPRGGVPDNLTRIRGVGERNEALLNSLGIFHFGQIAAWTPGEARWIGQYLAFPERIERDDWVGQAMILATGGDTGFEKSAERRRRRRLESKQELTKRQFADDVAAVTGRRIPAPPKPVVDDDEGSSDD